MTLAFSAELTSADFASLVRRAASVQSKTTMPILDYALLKGDGQTLTVASTNLHQSITSQVPCEATGACTANIARLQAISGALEKGVNVTMSVNGTGELTVKQGRSRYSMPTLPVEDYPAIADGNGTEMQAPSADLARSLQDLEGTVSNGKDARFYLQGVYFDTRDGSLVATDGKTLGRDPAEWCKANRAGFILPVSALRPVLDLCALGDAVSIVAGETSATFKAKHVSLWTKFIDGQFPDWTNVVPREWKSVWRMKRADMATAIKRMTALDRGGDYGLGIKFELGASEAVLTANVPDAGSAEGAFPCERVRGPDLTIGLGSKLVSWAVGALDGEETIEFSAVDAGSPVRLTPAGSQASFRIAMPQRIT